MQKLFFAVTHIVVNYKFVNCKLQIPLMHETLYELELKLQSLQIEKFICKLINEWSYLNDASN